MENLVIVILTVLVIVFLLYIIFLKTQIKRINDILVRRHTKNSNQMISVELLDSQINQLAQNINTTLAKDKKMQIKVMQDESEFKELIADISHDLRTPLTAIRGYLQLLSKTKLDKEQEKKLEIARKHTEELGELIEHFFEYSYLVDSKIQANPETLNLTNLVTECVAAVYPQLEEKKLQIELDEKQVMIHADKEMTVRIVQNLLRNCITHAKDRLAIIFAEYKQPGERTQVLFHVKNTVREGTQIDPKRIFDRFYVADQARSTTGLGLSIVKILVEQNGGSVSAVCKDGMLDIIVCFVGADGR